MLSCFMECFNLIAILNFFAKFVLFKHGNFQCFNVVCAFDCINFYFGSNKGSNQTALYQFL